MKSDYFLAPPPHKNKGSRDKYKHHVGYLVGNLGMFSTMSSWIFPGCFFVVFYPSFGAPCFFGRVLVLKIHKKPFGLPRRSIHFSTLTNAYQYQKHFQGTMLPNLVGFTGVCFGWCRRGKDCCNFLIQGATKKSGNRRSGSSACDFEK